MEYKTGSDHVFVSGTAVVWCIYFSRGSVIISTCRCWSKVHFFSFPGVTWSLVISVLYKMVTILVTTNIIIIVIWLIKIIFQADENRTFFNWCQLVLINFFIFLFSSVKASESTKQSSFLLKIKVFLCLIEKQSILI